MFSQKWNIRSVCRVFGVVRLWNLMLLLCFVTVRTLRLICVCAEDYRCLHEVDSTPKTAAMWVNPQLTLHWCFYWGTKRKNFGDQRAKNSVSGCYSLVSIPCTSLNFKIRGLSLLSSWWGGRDRYPDIVLRTLPLGSCPVRTHQCSSKPGTAGALLGLLPPIECLFPARPESGSSCLGFGTGPGPNKGLDEEKKRAGGLRRQRWCTESDKGSVGCSTHNGEHCSAPWTRLKFSCVDKIWPTHMKLNGCREDCFWCRFATPRSTDALIMNLAPAEFESWL